jgi:type IV pilus assembly protein PilN
MAHINLLPWREERRQERQQQFVIALVGAFIFAVLILYLAYSFVDGLIDEQNSRNAFIQQEIVKVDKKIQEIKELETEKEKLIARMQVIQDLQQSRPKAVKVLDGIVRTVPEGVHLESLKRTGKNLTFNGIAESNARVSVFMRELDKNTEFGESTLNVVQKSGQSDKASRKFTIQISESDPTEESGEQ